MLLLVIVRLPYLLLASALADQPHCTRPENENSATVSYAPFMKRAPVDCRAIGNGSHPAGVSDAVFAAPAPTRPAPFAPVHPPPQPAPVPGPVTIDEE